MSAAERNKASADFPLVVDMDGTLIKTDALHEALAQLILRKPIQALRALLMLSHGRAAFKAAVADYVLPDVGTVPIDEAVLETIKQARKGGRSVYLATASDRRFADAIAGSLGEFDGVFATEGKINLKGKAKADRLVAEFGAQGFDYIGNDVNDLPSWRVARTAFVSGASSRLMKRLSSERPTAIVLSTRKLAILPYIWALRPHQWLKNGLVGLPALTAHSFSISSLTTVLIAFVSMSFAASSIYIVNDMLDLPHDRAHAEKRYRSLAAGTVSISHAVLLFGLVASLSIVFALMLPWAFVFILITYFSFSMAYSIYLKRKLMLDVVALAALYGIRVLAGAAATGIVLSHWLIGFCFFIFLSLAFVKRASEMIAMAPTGVGNIKGRGYRNEDRLTIMPLTAASGFVAVLVFALYIDSPDVSTLYRNPELLWAICIVLVYWLGRVYFLAGRGEMPQDPVIFAATDRISLLTAVLILAILVAAI